MKNLIFLVIILLMSCKHTYNEGTNKNINNQDTVSDSKVNFLTTVEGWDIIKFKTNYTIQTPGSFGGVGITGFEGNVFFKYSHAGDIVLQYTFCTGLFCYDFGDTLASIIPAFIKVTDYTDYTRPLRTLDIRELFKKDLDTCGILYYSAIDPSVGKLYWKDNFFFKAALNIEFPLSKRDTVREIISTIKKN